MLVEASRDIQDVFVMANPPCMTSVALGTGVGIQVVQGGGL